MSQEFFTFHCSCNFATWRNEQERECVCLDIKQRKQKVSFWQRSQKTSQGNVNWKQGNGKEIGKKTKKTERKQKGNRKGNRKHNNIYQGEELTAETKVFPVSEGDTSTAMTSPPWPWKLCNKHDLSTSQRAHVLSPLPVIICKSVPGKRQHDM